MEDYLKNKKNIITIGIIIGIIIITIISIPIYQNYQKENNMKKFTQYLTNHEYKKEDVYYTKQEDNTTYYALYDDYILYKNEIKNTDDNFYNIGVGYTKNKSIEITYKTEGINSKNEIATLYQKGTYKDGNFRCEIITNNGLNTQCDFMKKEAKKFETEANNIIKNSKVHPKYLTIITPDN